MEEAVLFYILVFGCSISHSRPQHRIYQYVSSVLIVFAVTVCCTKIIVQQKHTHTHTHKSIPELIPGTFHVYLMKAATHIIIIINLDFQRQSWVYSM